jgi:ubiquinone/menaquinone biosynthesis C-methylase UbiE
MADQLQYWNDAHKKQLLHAYSLERTDYAEEVLSKIPPKASILELGCGEGNDSIYFATHGHKIIATDFSDIVINQNRQKWSHPRLDFQIEDVSLPLEFPDKSFDVVYARLSLHFFTSTITAKIFQEIARVLKEGGKLYFMCRSTNDPLYALYSKGTKIEDDMYELDGHIRRFFSEEYANLVLQKTGLVPESIKKGFETLYGKKGAFIKVIAKPGRA